jgi:hypothetical protein
MRSEEKKGSAVTSIIAAVIFVLILAIFGRSVHGGKSQQPTSHQPSIVAEESPVIGSGFYQIYVLDEAKHHFMPPLSDLQ